jgi:hypothetical protein
VIRLYGGPCRGRTWSQPQSSPRDGPDGIRSVTALGPGQAARWLAEASGTVRSVEKDFEFRTTVVSLQTSRDLDARAVSLEAVLGGRNVQSCDGYPVDPAPIMVEVFSGKDER